MGFVRPFPPAIQYCAHSEVIRDKRVQLENELSDSEDEGTGGRRNRKSRKLVHPIPEQVVGSEVSSRDGAGKGGQEATTANGEGTRRDGTSLISTEPLSPSTAAPGLSMNAFGRPKMTAAAVGADEDMDIDDPVMPGSAAHPAAG